MFRAFTQAIAVDALPETFTYPYYYHPHPLCRLAMRELQAQLQLQTDQTPDLVTGRMYAVLVVQTASGEIGYLAACRGKDNDDSPPGKCLVTAQHKPLPDKRAYREKISYLNQQISGLERHTALLALQQQRKTILQQADQEQAQFRQQLQKERAARKQQRITARARLNAQNYAHLLQQLGKQSFRSKKAYAVLKSDWQQKLEAIEQQISHWSDKIEQLKQQRSQLIAQRRADYANAFYFLNSQGETKTLNEIFTPGNIPARAGECAVPKLLNYAFQHQMKPLAFSQFWWGKSPKREVRQHQHHYPCCRGRCKPLLDHMLQGLQIETNPLIMRAEKTAAQIEIIYQDRDLLIINKPAGLLSVAGKEIKDAAYERIQCLYPQALLIHRLDMATSGIMVLALNKKAHQSMQQQFINRTIKKQYIAILDGIIHQQAGVIALPIQTDFHDRPRQIISAQGKKAYTRWQKIRQSGNKTWIYFYPQTGRTHQLRIHAAHQDGLNTPILGDVLYGRGSGKDRLYLHAASLTFQHPTTGNSMYFECASDFMVTE